MKSLVTHQAFNECDRLPVRRPPWNRHLKRRFVDGCGVALRDVDLVNLRDPPIVVAGTGSRSCYERLVVWRRSEERRVGKECRCRWSRCQWKDSTRQGEVLL